ncbi:MAG: DUF2752 domain-containing protein [Candidatus Cloacimonetes bacterium]|nr:DUF2752 domain-containing protein [Candidatus Cloacimonadota bacterium]
MPEISSVKQAPGTGKPLSEIAFRFATPVFFVLVILGLAFINPSASKYLPRCPFFALTGLKCPGCGSMRAFHALLHGGFASAWRFNAMAVLMLPFVVLGLIHNAVLGWEPAFLYRHVWFGWSLAGGTVLWWIFRNIIGC